MGMFAILIITILLASCDSATLMQAAHKSSSRAHYRSGLIMLQFPSSDGYVFDFSTADLSLEEPPTIDLTIGANALESFYAPHGIMMLGPISGCVILPVPDEDVVDTILTVGAS